MRIITGAQIADLTYYVDMTFNIMAGAMLVRCNSLLALNLLGWRIHILTP